MGNKPTGRRTIPNETIEEILARKRKVQPERPASPALSQEELKDSIVAAINKETARCSGDLAKRVKDLADALTAQRKQNKNNVKEGKKVMKKENDVILLHQAISNLVSEKELLPKHVHILTKKINLDGIIDACKVTHETNLFYSIPQLNVDGTITYNEAEVNLTLQTRHVAQIDTRDFQINGDEAVVNVLEDVINNDIHENLINVLVTEGVETTSIFTALAGMKKDVKNASIIVSPAYLETIMAMNQKLPYPVFVSPYLDGGVKCIVGNLKQVAVNFQLGKFLAKKRFDQNIVDCGLSILNKGIAKVKNDSNIFIIK